MTRSVFLKVIYNSLNEAGIDIPFPQTDLHIKDSIPFEIYIKKEENIDKKLDEKEKNENKQQDQVNKVF